MENRHYHIAPGTSPLIGRLHEVNAAQELATGAQANEGQLSAPPGADQWQSEKTAAADEEQRTPRHQPDTAGALPFIGTILHYAAGTAITLERRLTLQEDLHLADHHFVHAPGIKPLAACYPVLPMTVSLELMAEAASCLAPGYGLIGFADVTARRWIALADTEALTLRVEGRVERFDPLSDDYRIAVAVHVDGEAQPSILATLLFGKNYQLGLDFDFEQFEVESTLVAAQVFAQRQLFHGPRFQSLVGAIGLSRQGATAELLVRAPDDLFGSTQFPQMLTDPALLDSVGQLVGLWSMQHQRMAFPIGIGKLELYGPTPAPGTRVPVELRIVGQQLKMLSADVEIGDGAGGVWLRIKDWKSWQFQWDQRLVEFRRLPTWNLLSDTLELPEPCSNAVGQGVTAKCLAGFDLELLARHYLHMDEMALFFSKRATASRQLQWVLGRIASKDAVRAWYARATGSAEMLHPAAFAIENNAKGQPQVARWPDAMMRPMLSLAHCEDQAVAIAHSAPVGIDLERIVGRDAAFLNVISSASERALLAPFSGAEQDAWITRLWCAKEALGKRMGSGIDEAFSQFEAHAIDLDGTLHMCHCSSGTEVVVSTMRGGDFITAFGF